MRGELLLLFLHLVVQAVCYQSNNIFESEIENCVESIIAPHMSILQTFNEQLCIQCKPGFVVSKSYKQCLSIISQLPNFDFGNCKRLSQNGYCAEAINGIELLPNNEYSFSLFSQFYDRCAIVSKDYKSCLYPRFGYVLETKQQLLIKDTERTFCALYDSEKKYCSEFQGKFIRSQQWSNSGVYVGENFANADKIIQSSSFDPFIQCQEGYQYIIKSNIPNPFVKERNEGCIENSDDIQLKGEKKIENCKKYSNSHYCKSCLKGHALRDDKQECKQIHKFCAHFQVINKLITCTQCQPFYRLYYQTCIYMKGCNTVNEKNPNICTQCFQKFILADGYCILRKNQTIKEQSNKDENISGNKETQDSQNNEKDNPSDTKKDPNNDNNNNNNINSQQKFFIDEKIEYSQDFKEKCLKKGDNFCQKCKGSRMYYYNQTENKCLKRNFSLFCEQQVKNQDACITLKCNPLSKINLNIIPEFNLKDFDTLQFLQEITLFPIFEEYETNERMDELYDKYSKAGFQLKNNQICEQNSKTIDNCANYNNFLMQCTSCHINYKLELDIEKSQRYLFYNCVSLGENEVIANQKFIFECQLFDFSFEYCLKCTKQAEIYNPLTFKCEQGVLNCKIHISKDNCYLCNNGYQKTTDGKCEIMCRMPIFQSFGNYQAEFSYSKEKESQCKQIQIPCVKYVDDICVQCFEGYVLDKSKNNTCIQDVQFHDCSIIDKINDEDNVESENVKNGMKCILCEQGYRLFRGRCYCQKGECFRYLFCNERLCKKIYNNIFVKSKLMLEGNKYIVKKGDYYEVFDCTIENCLRCEDNNFCMTCRNGYYFNYKTKQCIPLQFGQRVLQPQIFDPVEDACEEYYNQSGKCKLCKQLYYLMLDYKCYEECPKGHIIQGINNICFTCPLNCTYCEINQALLQESITISCKQCISSLYLDPITLSCKQQCNYLIENQLFENNCVLKCNPSNFIKDKYCVSQCENYVYSNGIDRFCIDQCDEKYFMYEDDPKRCSDFCEYGYAAEPFKNICRKCKVENCKQCSMYHLDECAKCKEMYSYIKGKCLYACPNKLFVNTRQECAPSNISYCIEGQFDLCTKCAPNFILNEQSQCQCAEGYFFNILYSTCEKCDPNCIECDENLSCLKCAPYYYSLKQSYIATLNYPGGFLIRCVNTCPLGYFLKVYNSHEIYQEHRNKYGECLKCALEGCVRCKDERNCLECDPMLRLQESNRVFDLAQPNTVFKCICDNGFTYTEGHCLFECQSTKRYVSSEKDCCLVSLCEVCTQKQSICERCNQQQPYLFLNTCLRECPLGTFEDIETMKCLKCSTLCKSCKNAANQCTSCELSDNLIENKEFCRCTRGMVFFQGQCFQDCPRFTKLIEDERICEPYCSQFISYPVFDEHGKFERCESDFGQPVSKFCYQNLNNLNRHITFSIEEYGLENNYQQIQKVTIIVTIRQTPKDCYIFRLRGKDLDDQFPLVMSVKNSDESDIFKYKFTLFSEININQLKDRNTINCNNYFCFMYFEVYQKGILQQTIKLKVNYNAMIIGLEGVQDHNILLNTQQSLLQVDVIAQEMIVPSIHYIECGNNSICDYNSILTQPQVPVSITITASTAFGHVDSHLLTVYPLSLYILLPDKTRIPINDFYFENSFPSSIKLIIYFEQITKGQLVAVLRAYNQKYLLKGLENFSADNKDFKYIIQIIDVEVISKVKHEDIEINEDQNNQDSFGIQYQILLIFNTLISAAAIIFIIFKCIKKSSITIIPKKELEKDEDFFKMNEEKNEQSVSIELS